MGPISAGPRLQNAKLCEADLSKANFFEAKLIGASLKGAVLKGAKIKVKPKVRTTEANKIPKDVLEDPMKKKFFKLRQIENAAKPFWKRRSRQNERKIWRRDEVSSEGNPAIFR
jgi:hypothetical protein